MFAQTEARPGNIGWLPDTAYSMWDVSGGGGGGGGDYSTRVLSLREYSVTT